MVHSQRVLIAADSLLRQELGSKLLTWVEVAFAACDARKRQSHSLRVAERHIYAIDLLKDSPRLLHRAALIWIISRHRSLEM